MILWFPWSVNPNLGIAMMMSVMPLLWAFGAYLCLIHHTGDKLLMGCSLTALIFVAVSVILDFIFFGLIRQAWNDLYKPTTFYGYGFLAVLPFIECLIFKRRISVKRHVAIRKNFVILGIVSVVSVAVQAIILLNI